VRASGPARIGLVVGQLTTGGAEGQLWQLARALDRARFAPVVYCLSAKVDPVGTWLQDAGVTVRSTDRRGWGRVYWLAKALASDAIDVVHAWLYIANAVAGAAQLLRPSRVLVTSARNCKVQGQMSRMANVVAFRASTAIVANSHDVAEYIVRQYLAPRARIRVIYNGIDVDRFHPNGSASASPGPIVTVGRLVPQKNHELFLQAAAPLAGAVPEARFVIVGDGPLRPQLEASARRLSIADRVAFAGERRDVEALLRTASLFWLTSRWEGTPNVVLEAMASGVPVVATDVGGTRELIRSGSEGFVVPPEDVDGFVRHSRDLLADLAMRRRFAAAARARAEEFSNSRMVAAMTRLYDEVLP
jgi:glycosyltransferase involved in cell wall biosynthesis